MRTYSAEIRYDEDGTRFYGVYQSNYFIMKCPSMDVASEVAENLSTQYKQGLANGEAVGRVMEKKNIKTTIKEAHTVDLGEPPQSTSEYLSDTIDDIVEPYYMLTSEPPEPPPGKVYKEGVLPLTEGTMKGGNGAVKDRRDVLSVSKAMTRKVFKVLGTIIITMIVVYLVFTWT